jgi:tetratricopeptide (TPR) repeat protein
VDAQAVINALFQRGKTWRVIHIAGHGAPPVLVGPVPTKSDDPPQTVASRGGVVLSDQAFLGPLEIKSLRKVPELVVVNCCHLGIRAASAREGGRLAEPAPIDLDYDRPAFAAGVAEELIKIGVRCVIAAGWAVEDAPAEAFATKLYEALLRRERFMDAVALAREAAYNANPLGNTWAAYQCYGDPGWTLQLAGGDPQAPTAPPAAGLDAIASPLDLVLALELAATDAGAMNANTDQIREKIGYLEKRYGDLWRRYGRIAQAFGRAWSQAGDSAKAIEWYRAAVAANDGRAPIQAAEQLGNQLARQAATKVAKAQRGLADALVAAGGVAAAPAVQSARQALNQVLKAARRQVQEAIELLDRLVKLKPNLERASLSGSAYKRLAVIEEAAGNRRAAAQATDKMRDQYAMAERLGREQGLSDVSYPALNRIAASLNAKRAASRPVLSSEEISAVRKQLEDKNRADPDFWSIAGQSELTIYEAIDHRGLADKRPSIQRMLADLYVRAPDAWRWSSVRDQARFVLPRYAALMEQGRGERQQGQGRGRRSPRRAKGAGQGAREATAARSLLALIEGYAAGEPPAVPKG